MTERIRTSSLDLAATGKQMSFIAKPAQKLWLIVTEETLIKTVSASVLQDPGSHRPPDWTHTYLTLEPCCHGRPLVIHHMADAEAATLCQREKIDQNRVRLRAARFTAQGRHKVAAS
eukprot:56963-Eustigmatos_ZCMA.PRE.1